MRSPDHAQISPNRASLPSTRVRRQIQKLKSVRSEVRRDAAHTLGQSEILGLWERSAPRWQMRTRTSVWKRRWQWER